MYYHISTSYEAHVQKTSSINVIANLKILDRVYMWKDSLFIWYILWCSYQKIGGFKYSSKDCQYLVWYTLKVIWI